MRYFCYALLLLQLSFAAVADNSTELEKLYSALNMLNQQQQAVYQQFQMVQEIRRSNALAFESAPMPRQLYGQVPNYDEMVEAQNDAILRGEYLTQKADQLLAEYKEIEDKKKPVQSRIYDFSLKAGQD
jgi:hypothetical protein